MEKKKRISDIEVLKTISQSSDIRECLMNLYTNKNPGNPSYIRISRLMIENGIRFKDGGVYVHPSLDSLFIENKNLKPKIKINK